MNKATFDRAYKAIKGHMLSEVIAEVGDMFGKKYKVIDVRWEEDLDRIAIVIDNSDGV